MAGTVSISCGSFEASIFARDELQPNTRQTRIVESAIPASAAIDPARQCVAYRAPLSGKGASTVVAIASPTSTPEPISRRDTRHHREWRETVIHHIRRRIR